MSVVKLYSRTVRIGGNGTAYRDIEIHEYTPSQIRELRSRSFMAGMVVGALIVAFVALAVFLSR